MTVVTGKTHYLHLNNKKKSEQVGYCRWTDVWGMLHSQWLRKTKIKMLNRCHFSRHEKDEKAGRQYWKYFNISNITKSAAKKLTHLWKKHTISHHHIKALFPNTEKKTLFWLSSTWLKVILFCSCLVLKQTIEKETEGTVLPSPSWKWMHNLKFGGNFCFERNWLAICIKDSNWGHIYLVMLIASNRTQ